ncbi:hypothetical protein O181_004767 [Austropuccinia psidii MF-1]|uniref:Uncharacterized protein n=1 Tax=Austropuccinia psidii MF-1 TaxID=1389203 RepID=A0A9Q3BGX0_9BASI|nr:hypothetical protein [Austropuccinia psidii MF-1]
MTIIYKEVKSHTHSYGFSIWPLENVKSNSAYDPEVAARIPIHFMKIHRKNNFRFSQWAPGSGTPDTNQSETEETEIPIFRIRSSEISLKIMPNTNSVAYCCNSFNKNTAAQNLNPS